MRIYFGKSQKESENFHPTLPINDITSSLMSQPGKRLFNLANLMPIPTVFGQVG